jgi:hypothetical protein
MTTGAGRGMGLSFAKAALVAGHHVVAAQKTWWQGQDGRQGGNPDKLARALLTISDEQPPPRRLLAGADTITLAERKIAELQAAVDGHSGLTQAMGFDAEVAVAPGRGTRPGGALGCCGCGNGGASGGALEGRPEGADRGVGTADGACDSGCVAKLALDHRALRVGEVELGGVADVGGYVVAVVEELVDDMAADLPAGAEQGDAFGLGAHGCSSSLRT